jgi:hypothetical protein
MMGMGGGTASGGLQWIGIATMNKIMSLSRIVCGMWMTALDGCGKGVQTHSSDGGLISSECPFVMEHRSGWKWKSSRSIGSHTEMKLIQSERG